MANKDGRLRKPKQNKGSNLSKKLILGFIAGTVLGYAVNLLGFNDTNLFKETVAPILGLAGSVFIKSLKAIVVPIVFFSLISGAAQMPLKKSGRLGAKLMGLYLLTSLIATVVGLCSAMVFAPGKDLADLFRSSQSASNLQDIAAPSENPILNTLLNALENPFASLSSGNFLGFIIFGLAFGFAISSLGANNKKGKDILMAGIETINAALMEIVHWIMSLAPLAIAALACQNFATYGEKLVGPYLKTVLGIVLAVAVMTFAVYGTIVFVAKRMNVIEFLKMIRVPMVTAFATRSSAATLPASIEACTDNLKVESSFANFSLPIGATVNMDGVCVHLPMFAVLAANIYGLQLDFIQIATLTISTVLAAIGAGGVPGGSLMLLFLILSNLGLNEQQISLIVAIALGVNPILDMFETMNNVTGDIACTFAVSPDIDKS